MTLTVDARRLTLRAAIGVGLVAFAVRIRGALEFAFWQDEVGAAQAMLERTPFDVAVFVARFESTPPGFYVLGWAVHNLGVPLEEVRVLSAVAGAVLASGVVLYARRVLPLWASVLAGLSVALGYQFVFHGRELRSYELHALLCLGLAWAVLAFARAPDRRRGTGLALCVAAGSLTNYFFLLSVAAVVVWSWRAHVERHVQRRMALAIAVGLIPFVVWLPAMVKQYGHRDAYAYISAFRIDEVVSTYWQEFVRTQPSGALHHLAPLVVLAAVVAGCVLLDRLSDAGRLTALMATLPIVVSAAIWLAGPRIYDVRNMIGVAPFAAVALATLLARLRGRVAAVAACLAVALVAWSFVNSDRVKPVPYDGVAQGLASLGWRSTDSIVLYGNVFAFRGPLEWYLADQPALTLGEPTGFACPRLYIVAPRVVLRRELPSTALQGSRRVRGLVVARIGRQEPTSVRRLLRHGHLLVSAERRTRCALPVPEGLLNAQLRGAGRTPSAGTRKR